MCMRVVVLREMLGNRELCWSLWNGKEVMELTSKQIKDNIRKGTKICGLKIGTSGELEMDAETFFTTNIMEHRHCSNYVPLVQENCLANLMYVVIGSHEENGNVVYDCISTKWEQVKISESDLRAYLKIGIISGGAKIEDGKIVLADFDFPKEPSKSEEQEKPITEKTVEPTKKAVSKSVKATEDKSIVKNEEKDPAKQK